MKKILNKILIVSGLCAAVSCSFFEVEPQVICSDTFYKTEAEVKYGLAGVYGVMNNEEVYGNDYSLACSNIDDLSYFNRSASASNYLQWYAYGPGEAVVYDVWTEIYQGIRNANDFLQAVSQTDFDTEGALRAEARFLRAYYHFILAQAWGDVPLTDKPIKTPDDVMCAASPQLDVLKWCVSEMEACLSSIGNNVSETPSRVTKNTVFGILARVNLFMAGQSVKTTDAEKLACWTAARDYADSVIVNGAHKLNPDYSQVFKNMISDKYDTEYHESMWEVEFRGDRSNADNWSNGRIGDLLGLQSGDSNSSNYGDFKCNFAHAQYNGSLKLWNLYWQTDRTDAENQLSTITDKRQEWNMPPYNYKGSSDAPYGQTTGTAKVGVDKTPYKYNKVTTTADPIAARAVRNCGKFRREVDLEGQKTAKLLYTTVNYPILRYSDVLLMYAEASNELDGPTDKAYDCVKQVRDRAGVATRDAAEYDKDACRELVRNERGRELCFESLRKYDLIRWGIFVEEMHDYKSQVADEQWVKETTLSAIAVAIGTNVMEKHVVLPVPSIELGVNKLLVQNPLW